MILDILLYVAVYLLGARLTLTVVMWMDRRNPPNMDPDEAFKHNEGLAALWPFTLVAAVVITVWNITVRMGNR